jgi:hypothetical protein
VEVPCNLLCSHRLPFNPLPSTCRKVLKGNLQMLCPGLWAWGQSPKSRGLWARGLGCNALTSVPPKHNKNQGANKSQVGLPRFHFGNLSCKPSYLHLSHTTQLITYLNG